MTSSPARRAALIAELCADVQRLQAATTCAEVGAIYLDMVGYDSHLDDPSTPLDELRDDALDYVREVCDNGEIHVSEVGL